MSSIPVVAQLFPPSLLIYFYGINQSCKYNYVEMLFIDEIDECCFIHLQVKMLILFQNEVVFVWLDELVKMCINSLTQ